MPKLFTTPKLAGPVSSAMTPEALRAWRAGHGFSQKDAAHYLGMAPRDYQYRESGRTRNNYRMPFVERWIELATKGLDMELRLAKLRKQEGEASPVDAAKVTRLYRTLGGKDDAGRAKGVAQAARPHSA